MLQLLKAEVRLLYGARFFTLGSAVLGLGLSGCGCCMVRVFHPGFCCVRVRAIGLRLLYGARFPTGIYTRGFHWLPRLLASIKQACGVCAEFMVGLGLGLQPERLLPCVLPMAFLSGFNYSYRLTL
jgi:hypothetical protein